MLCYLNMPLLGQRRRFILALDLGLRGVLSMGSLPSWALGWGPTADDPSAMSCPQHHMSPRVPSISGGSIKLQGLENQIDKFKLVISARYFLT